MTWDKGFDFRDSAAYVTDPTDNTYVLGNAGGNLTLYPTTRNGATFGWLDTINSADRSTSVNPIFAGINYWPNSFGQGRFRLDLNAADTYTINVALGDAGHSQVDQQLDIYDDTSFLVSCTAATVAINNYADATGVVRTEADWPTDNVPTTQVFSTTTMIVKVGNTSGADNTTLAHLFVSQGGSPPAAVNFFYRRRAQ